MNDPEKFYRIIFLRSIKNKICFFIFPIRNCKFVISFNVQLPVHTVMRRGEARVTQTGELQVKFGSLRANYLQDLNMLL